VRVQSRGDIESRDTTFVSNYFVHGGGSDTETKVKSATIGSTIYRSQKETRLYELNHMCDNII